MTDGHAITCARIVYIDSEFDAKKGRGERPGFPVCICAIEIDQDGREIEHRLAAPYPERLPWDRGDSLLTIGFALGAEAGSYMHAGYALPSPAIDLYAEYMVLHNTEMVRAAGNDSKAPGPTLIQACQRYGVAGMDKARKDEMRALVYSKSEFTPEEIAAEQDYCLNDDCRMVSRLFRAMLPRLDLVRAPFRAAFMMEIERIRWRGKPIDMPLYRRTIERTPHIAAKLRSELNHKLGVEIFFNNVWKRNTVLRWMRQNQIPIPVDPRTRRETCAHKYIKDMLQTYPLLKIYGEGKRMIDALADLKKLEIGADGRNRAWLNPFGTKTGRNNPSTNKELLGLPYTMRSFMRPEPGMAIAQVDIGNEEIGFAAALSGDPVLMQDYRSGDPYLQFAAAALGVLNPTKQQRQVYKACVLGRIYGMGAEALARNLGISKAEAQRILDQMTARYPALNAWLERIQIKVAHAIPIVCLLGWSLAATGRPGEERTFLNFPMQANSAELMRLIIVRASHLPLIGCAHDSFLVEDAIDRIEQTVAELREIIRKASRDLLGGFELRAGYDPTKDCARYPDRFADEREREDGMRRWNRLMALIEEDDHGCGKVPDQGQATRGPDEEGSGTTKTTDQNTKEKVGIQSPVGQAPVSVD
jgi:DNA polymerase I